MLYLLVLLLFAVIAMVTSGLAYAERAWRYAMGATTLAAVLLVIWSADFLQRVARYFSGEIDLTVALAAAALPFGGVLLHLCARRQNTPRHAPGPDDDPLYRRFRAEKIRRRRLQRQQEEMLENSDGPLGPELNGEGR